MPNPSTPRSPRATTRSRPRTTTTAFCILSSLAILSNTAPFFAWAAQQYESSTSSSITHRITSSIAQHQSSLQDGVPRQFTQRELEDAAQYDDDAANEAMAERDEGDDGYLDFSSVDFGEVSVMPVSCVNYHNGHMIKFQFFEKSSSLNCHFKNIGTFVVSIAHYMRAYFNYQALTHGNDFSLPGDVGFLNCVQLKETVYDDIPLYAKIGCQHRDTYTSTKLQLLVYIDAQCSQAYSMDENNKNDGYDLNGYFLSNEVSFRPPFYSCQGCNPEEISNSFTKQYSAWYDDDYISQEGQQRQYDYQEEEVEEEEQNDDANAAAADDAYADNDDANDDGANDDGANAAAQTDDGSYYQQNDDTSYYVAYDDANANGDDANNYEDDGNNHYVNTDDTIYYNYAAHDDDFYGMDDDNERRRGLREWVPMENMVAYPLNLDASHSLTAKETKKDYEADFEQEMALIHRQLEQYNNQDDAVSAAAWNMCKKVHQYGMWCDADCQALDTFRVDEWSRSDVFLLVIMCVFMGAMMLLVFAKRVKAYERAAMWGDEPSSPSPGLPPCAMLMLFAIVFTIIVVLAALKFVNETLVFSVVTCALLFIYMLKLTLFESRKQVFLPARSGTRNHSLNEPIY